MWMIHSCGSRQNTCAGGVSRALFFATKTSRSSYLGKITLMVDVLVDLNAYDM